MGGRILWRMRPFSFWYDSIMRTFQPSENKVLVRRAPKKTHTESGIVLPEESQDKQTEGEVLAVGAGRWVGENSWAVAPCLPNQTVLFHAYAGKEVDFDGEEFLVMDFSDVLGVFV